jgi:hemoglobin-like flavoprotein
MTPQQIDLVTSSWAAVRPMADSAAALFYARLFEADPSLRPLFRGDLQQQGRKLMAALDLAVAGLPRWERLQPVLRQLGARHAGYGVKPQHYDTVGAALLWTLQQGLAEGFSRDVGEAWAQAYAAVAAAMQDTAGVPQAAG